jgi:hypothetical protein
VREICGVCCDTPIARPGQDCLTNGMYPREDAHIPSPIDKPARITFVRPTWRYDVRRRLASFDVGVCVRHTGCARSRHREGAPPAADRSIGSGRSIGPAVGRLARTPNVVIRKGASPTEPLARRRRTAQELQTPRLETSGEGFPVKGFGSDCPEPHPRAEPREPSLRTEPGWRRTLPNIQEGSS